VVVASCATGQVGLVLLALRVREVAALVDVQRQAQAALERAQVCAQDIRILGEVDRLERELAQPLATVNSRLAAASNAATALVCASTVLSLAPSVCDEILAHLVICACQHLCPL
jgi:hypothetical protein